MRGAPRHRLGLALHRGHGHRLRHGLAADVAEGDGRPQRDAGAGVVAAHDAGGVVAHRVQAGDGPVVGAQHARVLVGGQAGEGADVAHHQADGVERAVLQRRQAGVGAVVGVALVAVVGLAALAEVGVLAAARGFVEALDGGSSVGRHDLDGTAPARPAWRRASGSRRRWRPMGIGKGATQPRPYWRRRLWSHSSQAWMSLAPSAAGGHHGLHEVVVRVALVGEAPALRA
jgi:hypothetical protein